MDFNKYAQLGGGTTQKAYERLAALEALIAERKKVCFFQISLIALVMVAYKYPNLNQWSVLCNSRTRGQNYRILMLVLYALCFLFLNRSASELEILDFILIMTILTVPLVVLESMRSICAEQVKYNAVEESVYLAVIFAPRSEELMTFLRDNYPLVEKGKIQLIEFLQALQTNILELEGSPLFQRARIEE